MLLQIIYIFKLNVRLEWQQRQSYFAVILYVLTTTYFTYLVFNGIISPETWNSFFWIIFIFAAMHASHRSFYFEADRRFLLYYGMLKPRVLILGKILYHFIYLIFIGLISFICLLFFWKDIVVDPFAFLLLLLLTAASLSSTLTFVAGISAKASNNEALPLVLSIPLIYPQILALSRVGIRTLTGFSWETNASSLLILLLLAITALLLSYLLFTYLWQD